MIKQWFHKIFSIALALLVLVSTVSFTIEKHFCGDVLVDISIFSEAENCGMQTFEVIQKKSCCKNEIDVIQGQNELKFSNFEDLDFQQQPFLTVFTFSYLSLFEGAPQKTILHKGYSPPNLVADIQVLDQVFII